MTSERHIRHGVSRRLINPSLAYVRQLATTTLPEHRDPRQVRRSRTQRRIGIAVLGLFVLAGATGLLGTHTSQQTVRGAGYELSVTYPRICPATR